jgi:hypothetical protein
LTFIAKSAKLILGLVPQHCAGNRKFKRKNIEMDYTVETARIQALTLVRSLNLPRYADPLKALRNYPWDFAKGTRVDQRTLAEWNLELDGRSCLGRVAQAAALLEFQFSNVVIGYAEVLSDHLKADMLAQVHKSLPSEPELRSEWLQEVLLYEEPHAVVLVDGVQFDPLSTIYPAIICHPKVQEHRLWDAIASAMTVSKALLEQDPARKWEILEEAERICPGTTLVAENRSGALILLGREDEAAALLKELLIKRPCARTLFCLWLLTNAGEYRRRIDLEYTPYMFEILAQLLEAHHA